MRNNENENWLTAKVANESYVLHNPPYELRSFSEFPIIGEFYQKLKNNLYLLNPDFPDAGDKALMYEPIIFLRSLFSSSLKPELKEHLENIGHYIGSGYNEDKINGLNDRLEFFTSYDYFRLKDNGILEPKDFDYNIAPELSPFQSHALTPAKLFSEMLRFEDDRIIVGKYGKSTWKPWEEEPGLYLKFAKLNTEDEEAVKEFLKNYGPLGFIDLGYIYIHTWEKMRQEDCSNEPYEDAERKAAGRPSLDEERKERGLLWFEPLEYFQEHSRKIRTLLATYQKIKKNTTAKNLLEYNQKIRHRNKTQKIPKEDVGNFTKALAKESILAGEITKKINPAVRDASVILPKGGGAYFQGWLIFSLFHAVHILFYENILLGKAICARPGCTKFLPTQEWTLGKQKYCSPRCQWIVASQKYYLNKKLKTQTKILAECISLSMLPALPARACLPRKEKKSPGRKKKPDI